MELICFTILIWTYSHFIWCEKHYINLMVHIWKNRKFIKMGERHVFPVQPALTGITKLNVIQAEIFAFYTVT
jgi:hypothetical protein